MFFVHLTKGRRTIRGTCNSKGGCVDFMHIVCPTIRVKDHWRLRHNTQIVGSQGASHMWKVWQDNCLIIEVDDSELCGCYVLATIQITKQSSTTLHSLIYHLRKILHLSYYC
ncbi:hypothetical protein O6H91_01G160400 [Diphasiastrum complanatum]|uniref:Uncharacterized protein n=1 Tax=Diphasiastrum complanatum TaxID=34168 RepID=A0ACC2EXY6_DIPCM|nr:hypothetical protein O6H91_01G160400 [Diphasiastrum complanatum]